MIKISDQVRTVLALSLVRLDNLIIFFTDSTAETEVVISLYINRISSVDENKEEISFDVFLQVVWEDKRIEVINKSNDIDYVPAKSYIELTAQERHKIWVPDLYIRQLREMKVLTLFEEISILRLYQNSTIILSIG